MIQKIAVATIVTVLAAGTAYAASATYSWTGMGTNVSGSSKCATYKMTIDVTVDGTALKGQFQQQGRDQRHFEATLDGKGAFKTKATVGGGGTMDVTGTISETSGQVLLDGYCKFDGKLTRK
jgi:hypothetical protein